MTTGDVLTVVLAEYSALRAEIDRRSQAQQTLLNLAITLTGAIFAYAIANESLPVLLLQPIVASGLGLLYTDHGAAIRRLGRYLDRCTSTVAAEVVKEPRVMRWEALAALRVADWTPSWLWPPWLVFVGTSIATLVAALWARTSGAVARQSGLLRVPLWVNLGLWLLGLLLTLLAALMFVAAYRKGGLKGFDSALDDEMKRRTNDQSDAEARSGSGRNPGLGGESGAA